MFGLRCQIRTRQCRVPTHQDIWQQKQGFLSEPCPKIGIIFRVVSSITRRDTALPCPLTINFQDIALSQKPGFFPKPLPPTSNSHRNPVSLPPQGRPREPTRGPRNRVSFPNLCHIAASKIETRFLIPHLSAKLFEKIPRFFTFRTTLLTK